MAGSWLAGTSLAACGEISPKVRAFGSPRSRAPADWTRFDWEPKKAVLLGQYAPTDQELELIDEAVAGLTAHTPPRPRKVLVYYRCRYPHSSIATGNASFTRIGPATGAYEPTLSDDPADISAANLAEFDAVLLNNTTDFEQDLGADGRQALLDYVRGGGGLVGIHAAADSCKRWREGQALINGVFRCHPWLSGGTWAFRLESPAHPLNLSFDGRGFWHRDEVYIYRDGTHSRDRSRVLISLDPDQPHNREAKQLHEKQKDLAQEDVPRPVAWIHRFGEGRVFYSNLGHNNTTFWHPGALQHYLDGIQFALGDLEADTTPSGELELTEYAPAPDREL
ncbi:MAG: ThuA domain-containing protein [Planctomycetota bacterium]